MTGSSGSGSTLGLRERKKARTRVEIQDQALRLFREHGYDATTIEQIAEAAEVSPSTFFRYFPTKEDVVLYDAVDPRLAEAIGAQPKELGAIEAIRRAIRESFAQVPDDERLRQQERELLLRTVPELRARMLDDFVRTMHLISDLLAERSGRSANDPAVRSLAGAIIGISIAAWLDRGGGSHSEGYLVAVDKGLAELEAGFGL